MLKQTILVSLLALAPFATFAQDTPGSHFIENWDLDGNVGSGREWCCLA